MRSLDNLKKVLTTLALSFACASAYAIPVLQIGPGDASDPDWNWDAADESWIFSGTSASIYAYALDRAWKSGDNNVFTAYLSVAATPKTSDATDVFDVSVSNATLVETGYGAPPVSDGDLLDNHQHDVSSHGIFDTYYEVYEFVFSSTLVDVHNVQPGSGTGTTEGYSHLFEIALNSFDEEVEGIHFDLYTLDPNDPGKVYKFAPYSHDGGFHVPEPAALALMGAGLLMLSLGNRRKS